MAEILLVDDDLDYGESFADILRVRGYRVRLAADGRLGLAELDTKQPDLVLLDVDMPILGGPEMAWQMLLTNVGKEKIPLVFVSANVDLTEIASRIGTPYFLAKPFDLKVLLSLIERALAERVAPTWPRR